MEGMRFTRNRQNTRSFGGIFGGKSYGADRAGHVHRYSSSQDTSDSVSTSETCRSVLFEIEIPSIVLFLNRNKNSQNSPKRMHPKLHELNIRADWSDLALYTVHCKTAITGTLTWYPRNYLKWTQHSYCSENFERFRFF